MKLLRKTLVLLKSPTLILVAFICAVLAAATGPFGTYDSQTFPIRLIYWSLVTSVSVVMGTLCHQAAVAWVGADRPVLVDATLTVLMTVLFTPVLWGLTYAVLFYEGEEGPRLVKLSYYVAAITIGVCLLRRMLPKITAAPVAIDEDPDGQDPPRLLRRLSPDFRGPILRLMARDHLVDVISAAGTETLRLRFADAVDEMDPVLGYCTHRSHWVSAAAIAGVERTGARITLRMVNGDMVPVSRKYAPDLEAAGVI